MNVNVPDDARIVGGEDANRSYPYQISLQIKMEKYIAWLPQDDWAHNCGGSIVTPSCVVTAAHCVVNYTAGQLSILTGTNKLKGGGGVRYLVKNLTVHPNYRELESSDIAVMKIDGPIKFDEKTAPIEYSDQEIGGGINCTLTGWGYTTPIRFGNPPNDLQVAVLPSITNQECKERGLKPSETEMCTYSHFGQGACGVSDFSNCKLLSEWIWVDLWQENGLG